MIAKIRDPVTMTSEERLSEIAAILAKGYLRSLSRKGLDDQPDREAPCDTVVNGTENADLLEGVA